MVDPVEYIWALFEETPRPSHLPPCLFPNEYPFELGFKNYPQPVVPVTSGPLSSYHDHDRIPVPGEPGAPLSGAQISLLTSLMSPFPQQTLLSPHQLLPLSSQLMSQVTHPHILPLLQQIALPYRRLS